MRPSTPPLLMLLIVPAAWACTSPPATGPADGGAADAASPVADAGSPPADADPPPPVPQDAGPPPTCGDGATPTILAAGGERTHGATMVITGCRFGDDDAPGPRLFDAVDNQPAYEGLSVGDVVPTDEDAPWSRNGSPWATEVRLAEEDARPHRAAFYRAAGGSHGGDGFLGWPRALGGTRPPADQLLLYVSWWYRPSMDPGGGEPEGANKFIRIWDNDGAERSYVSWTHMHIGYSGSERTGWRSFTQDGRVGRWNRMEIIVDAERGTVRHYVNGVYQRVSHSSVGEFDIDDYEKRPEFADLGLNVAVLGFDHGLTSYGAMVTDFGEIYIDTTRARVEIGDAPTWAETRHREIQLPTAWSDGSIEVTLQEGSLEGLSGRYLYVIDAEGNVNEEGFPL